MSVSSPHITRADVEQFHDEGFLVLEKVVPENELEALRDECLRLVAERDREMDRLGVDRIDLDHAAAATSSTRTARARGSSSSFSLI